MFTPGSRARPTARRRYETSALSGLPLHLGDGGLAAEDSTIYHHFVTRRLPQRLTAELLGTLFLVAAVVGSGIMAERLTGGSGGNVALALLCNTIATGAALVALILAFGGISGAHFNPAVSLADAFAGGLRWPEAAAYVGAQIAGGIAGVAIVNLMFGMTLFTPSQHARSGAAQVFAEWIATFGLMAVTWGCVRARSNATAFAVGGYIMAASWFTSSTSFANPAVTLARSLTDTFTGIRPQDAPAFIAAQLTGALAATALFRWLLPAVSVHAEEVLMPHAANPRTFLFACTHNAGRSQMAAALFNRYADRDCCRGISAGTAPAERVHPEVAEVMKEVGIDLRGSRLQKLDERLAASADVLVTMGCGEACPYVPGLKIIDWQLPDPKGQPMTMVRGLRDDIGSRVKELLRAECGA